MPNLYIIGGPNGAGKTTAAMTVLPEILDCFEFVNADAIAAGLSPFKPESVAFEAGRLMLERIELLLSQHIDFAIETTLATKSYVSLVKKAQSFGYEVTLLFLWLPSAEMAVERVKKRVLTGGHDIPEEIVRRRYGRGLRNLIKDFMPICNHWHIYENIDGQYNEIIRSSNGNVTIVKIELWELIKHSYERH